MLPLGLKPNRGKGKIYFFLFSVVCVPTSRRKKIHTGIKYNRCEALGVIPGGAIFPGVDLGRRRRYSNANCEGAGGAGFVFTASGHGLADP
jgi:hypothetical protein